MKKYSRWYLPIVLILVALCLFAPLSCLTSTSQGSSFYDAGNSDFNPTKAQFSQYVIFRFDTSSASHTFTTPSAADIVSGVQTPAVGSVIVFVIVADGSNPVTIQGGPNVIIKPTVATVDPNTTKTVYVILNNVSSGSQAVTLY